MIRISEEDKQEEKEEVKEKPDSQGLVDRGIETAERLERVNKKHEELLERQEALAVTNALGGKSDAGSVEQSKEEKDKEEAKKLTGGMPCEGVTDE